MAIRENRLTVRKAIKSLLPDLNIGDVFWTSTNCPDCKDDHEYFFVVDFRFYRVQTNGYVDGGYVCCGCGWSNAGSIHLSELPDDYAKNYPKS